MNKGPFTKEQIEIINEYQKNMYVHPLTCGNAKCRAVLEMTENGLVCPECDYTQDWVPGCFIDGV